MAITLDGTTGITTPGLTNTGTETIVNLTTTGNTILGDASTDTLNVGNGGLIKDASGNVGIGVTPYAWTTASGYKSIDTAYAAFFGFNGGTGVSQNATLTSTGWKYRDSLTAQRYEQSGGTHNWYTAPSGTAGNAITFTQAMTLDASGNLLVGTTSGSYHRFVKPVGTAGAPIVSIGDTGTDYHLFNHCRDINWNAAATGYNLGRVVTTNRSLNAGGTINASGADYAEYMTKADSFVLAKGDVVGIDGNGKLTNVFADAVSFVVKSTDPSYVGGDTWGNEKAIGSRPKDDATQEEKDAFEETLEAARQTVDRIAFAGQVPVNVLGATAGQYIIPVNDNGAIKGEAVTSPTFEQYQTAVGKVIAIEADGRARIIVKVA